MPEYQSGFQPSLDRDNMKAAGYRVGQNILEKTIVFGAQGIKFVAQFVIDALKQVIGR